MIKISSARLCVRFRAVGDFSAESTLSMRSWESQQQYELRLVSWFLDFDSVLERIYSIQIFAGFWYHSESLKNHLILHFRSKFINRHCVVTRFLDLTFRQSFLEITFKQFDTVFISKLHHRISETIPEWKKNRSEMNLKWVKFAFLRNLASWVISELSPASII